MAEAAARRVRAAANGDGPAGEGGTKGRSRQDVIVEDIPVLAGAPGRLRVQQEHLPVRPQGPEGHSLVVCLGVTASTEYVRVVLENLRRIEHLRQAGEMETSLAYQALPGAWKDLRRSEAGRGAKDSGTCESRSGADRGQDCLSERGDCLHERTEKLSLVVAGAQSHGVSLGRE
eukprot:9284248-Pyramimonas_sp.AAC.1